MQRPLDRENATPLEIPYVDLTAAYRDEREDILNICDRVFSEGRFVLGPALWELEDQLSRYLGGVPVVALRSGTDALMIAFHLAGIGSGDEVITVPNSFVATAGAIVHLGARPVFVDVGNDLNMDPERIESAITPRCRAIVPVHLTGRVANMEAITEIADRHGLLVIEDAAQAMGARKGGRLAGTFGQMGCFSAHPLKNLAAAGDAGFLVFNCDLNPDAARLYRNHGLRDRDHQESFGLNCRLDVLQCRILMYRLEKLDESNQRRRQLVAHYRVELNGSGVEVPEERADECPVYHTFVVQVDDRDRIQEALRESGIGSAIHYPIPIHLQPPYRALGFQPGDFPNTERLAGRILSLPIQPHLTEAQVARVARVLRAAVGESGEVGDVYEEV